MFYDLISSVSINRFGGQKNFAQNTYMYIKQYLKDTDFILDVGSGSGRVANLINKNLGIKVICIDIRDKSRVDNKPILFDGINLPFKDNMFTTVLGCFVLHHAQHQKAVLEEMKRVTSSEIIIIEYIPNTIFDGLLIVCHRIAARIKHKSINMKFRKSDEWQELFCKIGLRVKKEIKIKRNRELFYPVSRQLYLLSK